MYHCWIPTLIGSLHYSFTILWCLNLQSVRLALIILFSLPIILFPYSIPPNGSIILQLLRIIPILFSKMSRVLAVIRVYIRVNAPLLRVLYARVHVLVRTRTYVFARYYSK